MTFFDLSVPDQSYWLKLGTVLKDRYEIMWEMSPLSPIYSAVDRNASASSLVVIKQFGFCSDESRQVLEREVATWMALEHPSINKIIDFWEEDSQAYLVMEYIDGVDLDYVIRKCPRFLPIDSVVQLGADLCGLLDFLQNQKPEPIVMRDLYPGHILIDMDRRMHLVDFGISKLITWINVNRQWFFPGHQDYAAPEQFLGDLQPQSAIYQVGATLYHLLIFARCNPRWQPPPPFSYESRTIKHYNPDVSDELCEIVMKAVKWKSEDRWQSAVEMKAALEKLR